MLSLVNNGAYAYCSVICFSMEPVTSNCILPPGQGPHTHGGNQNNHVPATLYPIVKVLSKHDQRENKLKRKREETAEKENSPASVTDGRMKPSMGNLSENTVVSATRTPPPEPPKKLKRKREETTEKENLPASVTDGQMKPSMGNLSENAVVSATSTPPPEELPKNQKSALRPLTTQNSTEVQMKHPGSPDLIYVKPKDKTKDSGRARLLFCPGCFLDFRLWPALRVKALLLKGFGGPVRLGYDVFLFLFFLLLMYISPDPSCEAVFPTFSRTARET
ncbi:uncharacterized protein LOC115650187 isoform X3 [Gopherus evgoodei]|uniref:uncharacterized protein LOC115650187 isoform X3 n=1 Tax=Gopherus evgoodei TaxID=1825980 RepID=UPI0011CFFB7F|nr:uncharacterized protein LOC115650187 isoform X3 [Gopherus evgoodei]